MSVRSRSCISVQSSSMAQYSMFLVLGGRSEADHPGSAAAVTGRLRCWSGCSPTASYTDPTGANYPDWSTATSPGTNEAGARAAPRRQTGASGKPTGSPDAGKSSRSGWRTAQSPDHSTAGAATTQPTRSQGDCLFVFKLFS